MLHFKVNSSRKILLYWPPAWVEKVRFSKYMKPFSINFPNINNDYLLCNVIDSFLLLLVSEGDFSRPAPTPCLHVFHVPLDTVFNKMWLKKRCKMNTSLLVKRFSVRDRNITQDWSGCIRRIPYIWFWVEVNVFQTGKTSVQVRAAP